jgi:hypothetical protein
MSLRTNSQHSQYSFFLENIHNILVNNIKRKSTYVVTPTNMTIFKSLEYSCLQICNVDDAKVIDWICTSSNLIFQPESNKHQTKTYGKSKSQRITLLL